MTELIIGDLPLSAKQRLVRQMDAGSPLECWEWTGTRTPMGYGKLSLTTAPGVYKEVYTHRIMYTLAHGPIPAGLNVLHSCDNPPCCNPRHLRAGTQAENIQDREARNPVRRHVPRGEASKAAKLTSAQVSAMRERYTKGDISQRRLAAIYGVVQGTVWSALQRRTWRGSNG